MVDSHSPASTRNLRYSVDEQPPHALSALLALQVVALIITGIGITPLIVVRAAGIDEAYGSWVVFAALLISGSTTILQARRIGPIGSGHALFMGTSGAFIAVGIAAAADGGLALLGTLIVASSLIQFALAARLSLLRRILTPAVGGVTLMLISVTVFPVVFDLLSTVPEGSQAGTEAAALVGGSTFLVTTGILLFARGPLKLWGPLFGISSGCLMAIPAGLLDFSAVTAAGWFGLPHASWPGLDLTFDASFWLLLPAFLIVTIVGAIETYGDGISIQRISRREQRPLDHKVVQGAVYADAVGNLLSGLVGTLPNTTYSDSLSVVEMTGVAARRIAVYGGLILIFLAFSPKLSALLQTIPSPVMGGFVFVTLSLLFGHGLRLAMEGGLSFQNGFIVCIAFWLGMGFQNQWIYPEILPDWSRTILDNGMTAGAIFAILLMAVLNLASGRRPHRSLRASPAAVRELHEWVQEEAVSLGWDKPAVTRLQLAAEEAMLYLLDRTSGPRRTSARKLTVSLQEEAGLVTLELFIGGQSDENILARLSALEPLPDPEAGEDAGLRILRGLVRHLEHQQYNEGEYLSLTLDSTPLS